jgi:hypothetical protein
MREGVLSLTILCRFLAVMDSEEHLPTLGENNDLDAGQSSVNSSDTRLIQ